MPGTEKSWNDGEYAIVHLSDLHFGSPNYREVWALTEQALLELAPALLLVTGDLVDTPRHKLYLEAKEALDRLRIPYFVCAGNHDRFYRGNQLPRSTHAIVGSVLVLLGTLIGVPLLWLSAWSWAWTVVLLLALGGCWQSRRRVLWHWTRWRVDDQFAEVFQSKILSHEELKLLTIPMPAPDEENIAEERWTIGLLGDDSNVSADASARGYLPSTHFLPIRTATEGKDCEVCLFLVHHHLLSIRRLEEDRLNKLGALFNLTNMVNAGSLLETLAASHIDLVLHGHEHEHNYAAYGSLAGGSDPVKVVAAGSATGNRTLLGCMKQHVTFNVLVLACDRSVVLRRYWLDAERWRSEFVATLDAASLRLNRLRRLHRWSGDLTNEITKFVEFTRERDIWVYWVYTNWLLPSEEFVQEVVNSTGELAKEEAVDSTGVQAKNARVRIRVSPGPAEDLETTIERVPGKPNTWKIRAPVPPGYSERPVRLELKYCWRGGGILTEEEMKGTADFRQELGTPRSRGHEFVTGWTNRPVRALDVAVALPQEYASITSGNEPEVEVCVEHGGRRVRHQEIELRPNLQILSKGLFSLRIDYPQDGYDYQIAWKPPPLRMVNQLMENDEPLAKFVATSHRKGNELLNVFRKRLHEATFPAFSSLALYVPSKSDESNLERVACVGWTEKDVPACDAMPAPLIPLVGTQEVLARAWWGEPLGEVRPNDRVQAHRRGFLLDERVVFGVPIRLSLSSLNPPPWAVVRIGVAGSDQDLQAFENPGKLSTILVAAATVLLSAALDADYNPDSPSHYRGTSTPRG
jgi:predicted phosphodiesterase